ncbi:MAG: PEP-CTERM sorting domain-containing protein [Zoogloea sp.]|nr:PEP-CTERM sorting domain-containing protein [Zoogloea sp.]
MIKTNAMKTLVISLMALGTLAATPAHADTLEIQGSATAGATSNTFGPTTDTSYIGDGASSVDAAGNFASADAWGNSHGTYRSSTYGEGYFDSTATFHRTLSIINSSAYATQYTMNFFIYYGSLNINGYTTGTASYDLNINKVNGATTSLFASGATLDASGSVVQTGQALDGAGTGGPGADHSYAWNGTNISRDLGILDAGGMMTINFNLVTTARGILPSGSGLCGFADVSAVAALTVVDPTQCAKIYASLGDPGDIEPDTLMPLNAVFGITGRQANPIPLPGTLSLVGVGLAALGLARRRH